MTVSDYLIVARGFIVRGWARPDTLALDAKGCPVLPEAKEAVAWDVLGSLYAAGCTEAVLRLDQEEKHNLHGDAGSALRIHIPEGKLHLFNDAPGRTKEEVLELFDKAIALASNPEGLMRIHKYSKESLKGFERGDPADWWKDKE